MRPPTIESAGARRLPIEQPGLSDHRIRRGRRARRLQPAIQLVIEKLESRVLLSGGVHGSGASSPAVNSAVYLDADLTSQGNWKGSYGADGYVIPDNSSAPPSYAQVGVSGANLYTWSGSTTDVRGVISPNGTRVATTYYGGSSGNQSGFDLTVGINDGQVHPVAFYLVDWDSTGRGENVRAIDPSSSAVLDTRSVSNFHGGEYLVYNVTGQVDFSFTCAAGANAVVSGIFFGSALSSAPNHAPVLGAATAILPPVNPSDTTNAGSSVSGLVSNLKITDADLGAAQGIAITGADNSLGAWQYSTNGGSTWTNVGAVSSQAALLLSNASSNRLRLAAGSFTGTVTLTLRAWDQSAGVNGGAADASTGGGATPFSATTAIASLSITAAPTTGATYLGTDFVTQGSWIGRYGADGYDLARSTPILPTYGSFGNTDASTYNWAGSTTNLAALQTPSGTDRSAPTWYGSSISTDVLTTDGFAHQLAMYFVDYDSLGRSEQVQLVNIDTGAVLDTRTLKNFSAGLYLVYNITGNVRVNVTVLSGMNAVMSGLFIGGGAQNGLNHAPVLSGNNTLSLPSIAENDQNNTGSTVASLLASAGITDVDANAKAGMAIVAADSTNGAWQFSIDGISWFPIGSVSSTSARLLGVGAGDRIRFLPAANYRGPATFTFRGWDQTDSFDGGASDASATGGTTAFSTTTAVATLTVTPVNQAPVLPSLTTQSTSTGHTLTYVLPAATDIDSPANSLTYSASNLPAGATFNPATRTLTWTPTAIPTGGGIALPTDPTPISLTGWNYDAISENSAHPFAQSFDGTETASVSWFESGLGGYYDGLPAGNAPFASQLVNTVTGGHTTFQFQPYTSNNTLILKDYERNTRALNLVTPAKYTSISILDASNHVQPFVGANVGLVRLVYYINGNSGPTASTDGNFPLPSGLHGDPNRNNARHYDASTWYTDFIYNNGTGQAPSAIGNLAYNANINTDGSGFQHIADHPVGMYETDASLVNSFKVNGVVTDISGKYIKAMYFRKADSAPGGNTGIFAVSGVANTTTPAGAADVVFTVSDGQLTQSQALRINVADGSISPPLALASIPDQSAMVLTPLSFTLKSTGTATGALTFSATSLPPGATFDPASKVFNWTPAATQASGAYTASFSVTDGTHTATETVNINLLTVTPAPTVTDHVYTVAADTTLNVSADTGVLVGASDPLGLAILADVTTWPLHAASPAQFFVNDDGSFTYTPAPGFNGIDTFTFAADNERFNNPISDPGTVTIAVGHITPQPPVAQADSQSTYRNGAITIAAATLLANDSTSSFNGPNQALSISAVTPTQNTNGTVQLNADGSVTYIPTPGFVGTADFTYTLQDTGSIFGQPFVTTATATVTVQVTDRPPVANAGASQFINAGSTANFDASASSDPDGDPLLYTWSFGDGTTGSGVATGHVFADPGTYVVTLSVDDGIQKQTAASQVTVNDMPPTATFGNGGNVLIGSAGTVSFTGAADISPAVQAAGFTYSYDFNNDGIFDISHTVSPSATVPASFLTTPGAHTIRGRIIDINGGCTEYTTTINVVTPVNQPPTTQPDSESTFRNAPLTIPVANLLALDTPGPSYEAGQTLTVTAVSATAATHGSVLLNGNGTITYTPTAGYFGPASFSYTVQDNGTTNGLPDPKSTSGIVNVTITARPPTAVASGTQNASAGTTFAFNGSSSSSPDGSPLTYAWTFGDGGTGTGVSVNHVFADPGVYTVTLTVNDGAFTASTTLSATVNDVAPTATFTNGGSVTVGQAGAVTFSNAVDISPADTAAGFTYSYDFNNDGVFEISNSPSPTAAVPTSFLTAVGSQTIRGRITDSHGQHSDYTTAINVTAAVTGPTTGYVATDTTTQGNWKGIYGADGYVIAGDTSQTCAYAQVSITGKSDWTWDANPAATQATQRAVTGRVAATYYTGATMTVDVNITDGQTHQVALYLLDWDSGNRSETVQMINAANGTVLDSRLVSGMSGGKYVVFNVTGHVQFQITNAPGSLNAVMSGIFFGGSVPAQPPPSSNPSTFLSTDLTSQGTWKGTYGADGYIIAGDTIQSPSYAQVSLSGKSDYTWDANPAASQATQRAGTGRVAATYYSAATITADVNITDGKSHQIALYLLDWDASNRNETVQMVDVASGTVLDARNVGSLSNGKYLVYNVSGHVQFRIINGNGSFNAVLSGIFFGGSTPVQPTPPPTGVSAFLSSDTNTQGNWKGVYGADGFQVVDDSTQYPSYAQVGFTGQSDWVWSANATTSAALQNTGGRIASTYYSSGSFTADVNITDGQTHRVALYLLDWDARNRAQTVQMIDPATGVVINTQSVSGFSGGKYLVYNVTGHVQFRVINADGSVNAVLSGIFFG